MPSPRLLPPAGAHSLIWLHILAESLNWHVFDIAKERLQQKRRGHLKPFLVKDGFLPGWGHSAPSVEPPLPSPSSSRATPTRRMLKKPVCGATAGREPEHRHGLTA